MNSDSQEFLHLITIAGVFFFVFAIWIMGLLIAMMRRSARAGKIEQRLGLYETDGSDARTLSLWHEEKEIRTKVATRGRKLGFVQRFDALLSEAGWHVPASAVGLGLLGIVVLCEVVLYLLTGNVFAGLCLAGVIVTGFWFFLLKRAASRRALYEMQLVDALDLAARSLRAGHPLLGSFQLISEEIGAPVSDTFAEICGHHSLGLNLETALDKVAEQSTSDDMRLFSTSVIIQRRTGGNLAEMMERLAEVIRERMRLNRRVRVLTAQTQFSKRVLLALPIVVFFVLNLLSPQYMEPLYTTRAGNMLLGVGVLQLLAGAWVMNKMVKVIG